MSFYICIRPEGSSTGKSKTQLKYVLSSSCSLRLEENISVWSKRGEFTEHIILEYWLEIQIRPD